MKRNILLMLFLLLAGYGCKSASLSERVLCEGWKPSAPTASQEQVYEVVAGDTLWRIARQYRISVEALKTRNVIQDEKSLSVGTLLVIPDAAVIPSPVLPAIVAPAPKPVVAKAAREKSATSKSTTPATRTAGQSGIGRKP